jgi:hypothetical protein
MAEMLVCSPRCRSGGSIEAAIEIVISGGFKPRTEVRSIEVMITREGQNSSMASFIKTQASARGAVGA